MKLFLCSHFPSVASLIKDDIKDKKIAFVITASVIYSNTTYVDDSRNKLISLGGFPLDIDISTFEFSKVKELFKASDIIYFTGGNSFFLMDKLRSTGVDKLLKEELNNGKLFIGESAGAIICSPTITYIEAMDEKPSNYSQLDDSGLNLIDFYIVPHYKSAEFSKEAQRILNEYSNLKLCPLTNNQVAIINNDIINIKTSL